MQSSLPPGRYRAIDGFRFMAAIGVVLLHYVRYSEHLWWKDIFEKCYVFVDLFFIISGFVIAAAYGESLRNGRQYLGFLQNRLARIYPLHLAVLLVFFAIEFAAWRGYYTPREAHVSDRLEIFTNLALMQAWGLSPRVSFNYPSWSISAEWMLYLLFPAVAFAMRRGGAILLFALSAAIFAGLEVWTQASHLPHWTGLTYDLGCLRALPTFLAGAGLFCCVEFSARLFRSFAWSWAFFIAAIVSGLLWLDDQLIIALFFLTIAAATGAEKAGAKGLLTSKAMGQLGDWSYAIYMIHVLFGVVVVGNLSSRLLHLHGWALDLYILGCVVAVTGLAALVYRFFEMPLRRFFRYREKKLRNDRPSIARSTCDEANQCQRVLTHWFASLRSQ